MAPWKVFTRGFSDGNWVSYAQGEDDDDMGCTVTVVSHKIQVIDGSHTVVKVPTYWSFFLAIDGTDTVEFRYEPKGSEELSEELVNRVIRRHLHWRLTQVT